MNEPSPPSGNRTRTLIVAAIVLVLFAGGLAVALRGAIGDGQGAEGPATGTTQAGSQAAPPAGSWQADWASAGFEGDLAIPPGGVDGAVAVLKGRDGAPITAADVLAAQVAAWQDGGAMVAVDARRRRTTPLYNAGALATALAAGAKPAVHPLEATWLVYALAKHAGLDASFAWAKEAVDTPLMLSRSKFGVLVGQTWIGPLGAAEAGERMSEAEAVALWLVLRAHGQRLQGAFAAAHRDLALADKLRPGLAAVQFARGVLQIEQGLVDRGTETCEAALVKREDPLARLFLADMATSASKPFKAFEMVEAAIRAAPDLADAHVARGMLRAGRVESAPTEQRAELIASARESFDRAVALDPKVPGAVSGLAQLDLAAGQEDAALKRLQDAVAASADLEAGAMLAQLLLQRDKADEAIAVLDKVAQKDEERWWLLKLQALAIAGKSDEAIAAGEEAGGLFPAARQVRVLRAQLLRRAGRPADAAELLRPLEDIEGEDAAGYTAMRAELLIEAGKGDEAIAALQKALAAAPKQKDANLLLIAALGRAGRTTERDAAVAKAVSNGASTHEEIASMLLDLGDAFGAEAVLKLALDTVAADTEGGRRIAALLGMLAVASGRKDDAVALRARLVQAAGGEASEPGKAMAKAMDEAIAGAEAELTKMAEEQAQQGAEGAAAPAAAEAP